METKKNYHLIWLTNTEAHDLRILPTHRLIKKLDYFDEAAIMKKFAKNFKIKPVAEASDIHEFIEDVKKVCGSGCTMPQKSTFFYPKAICGFLFSSL